MGLLLLMVKCYQVDLTITNKLLKFLFAKADQHKHLTICNFPLDSNLKSFIVNNSKLLILGPVLI